MTSGLSEMCLFVEVYVVQSVVNGVDLSAVGVLFSHPG
jgi:hypothetical protein